MSHDLPASYIKVKLVERIEALSKTKGWGMTAIMTRQIAKKVLSANEKKPLTREELVKTIQFLETLPLL